MKSRAAALLTVPLLCILAGCGALDQQVSQQDRSTLSDCRVEADRVFNAQNRYQISERDSSDTPNSSNALPGNPNNDLSDRYARDKLVDSCLARHGATAPAGTTP